MIGSEFRMNVNNYFIETPTNIINNSKLRNPQIDSYIATYNHFITKKSKEAAIIVLPTGVGKTGVISMIPYNIANGRVLVVAPQMTVLSTLEKALNSDEFSCFWYDKKVIKNIDKLPQVSVYKGGDLHNSVYENSNIVLTNIQQANIKNTKSIINKLPPDFFDMIIIDEAHHAEANTWLNAISHFKNAKVVKLTGTPFRTDEKELTGELIFKYKLSQAMANNYIKSLESIDYVPEELKLTIDDTDDKLYTIEELYDMGIDDEQWISRSVAYSNTCKNSIIDNSIKSLESKKKNSSVPHKIIASAMTIPEAEKIKTMYIKRGLPTTVIHSGMDEEDKEKVYSDIDNNRVEVVVNVAMFGEGYDHKYFSVAAIFRPFRSLLPYEQFIGRILRYIPDEEATKAEDNIATVVSHKYFYMEKLWQNYKNEMQEADIILGIRKIDEDISKEGERNGSIQVYGKVSEIGQGFVEKDIYLDTELLKRDAEEKKERKKKIEDLKDLLNISDEEAEDIIDSSKTTIDAKRPDLLYNKTRIATNTNIEEVIVPKILRESNIEPKGTEIFDEFLKIFPRKYIWISKKNDKNDAILVIYLNTYLKERIGYGRPNWSFEDYETASKLLTEQAQFIENKLKGE